jgi:hypothetical protein
MRPKKDVKGFYSDLVLQVFNTKSKDDLMALTDDDLGLIDQALEALSEKEQQVIRLRYGLETGMPLTYEKIGEHLGVTKQRVKQLEMRSRNRLRKHGKLGRHVFFGTDLRENIMILRNEIKVLQERITACEINNRQEVKDWFFSILSQTQLSKAFPVLDKRVDEFEFSQRLRNGFRKLKVDTLYDVVIKTEQDFYNVRNLGRQCVSELKAFLSEHGLSFGMNLEKTA